LQGSAVCFAGFRCGHTDCEHKATSKQASKKEAQPGALSLSSPPPQRATAAVMDSQGCWVAAVEQCDAKLKEAW
jgi:hypothetical protein